MWFISDRPGCKMLCMRTMHPVSDLNRSQGDFQKCYFWTPSRAAAPSAIDPHQAPNENNNNNRCILQIIIMKKNPGYCATLCHFSISTENITENNK